MPVIENPEPAVYQLRDPKSRNTSVCLFTDFDSNVNLSESVLPGVPHTQPTVLNMKSLDSKSNAAVAWSSKSNFDCRNTFGDPTFYPSSDYPCNATLVEESFETDMNLNLENLSVMALRILLLKVAGFNLLMTLRLWSS
uniref:T-cell receptor alpha chain constant domain-containing protein n=1 Tax=Cavia porcellus TaxID=10141 RepID=A0A286XFH0_CAVPO